MTAIPFHTLDAWIRNRRNLSIYWQIVLLCAAMILLTIASSWIVADILSGVHKAELVAGYGIPAGVAHRIYIDTLHQSLVSALVAGCGASIVAGALLVPVILQPFRDMAQSADSVAEGDFSVRVPLDRVPPECEVYALGGAFNRMAMRLEFIEGARKRMIADLSHDLLSPLSNLRGYVEGVRDGVVTLSPSTIALLEGEIGRLMRLLGDLNQFNLAEGRRAALRPGPHNVRELLDEARRFAALTARDRGLAIDLSIDAGVSILHADRDAVLRALQNILDNAIRHADAHSVIHLTASADDDCIHIGCVNTGDPIAPVDLPLIFERFYRANPARAREGGAGLGLAIAKELVEAHDGRIFAESAERKTRIVMQFPLRASKGLAS